MLIGFPQPIDKLEFGEEMPSPLGKVARHRRDGRGAAPTNSWRRTRANWRGTSPDLADARPPSPKGRAWASPQIAICLLHRQPVGQKKEPLTFGEGLFFMVKQNLLHPNFLHGWQA